MRKPIIILLCISITGIYFSCKNTTNSFESDTVIHPKIESYILNTMSSHKIPGLAVAVVQNGEVVHKNYYGKTSINNEDLVNDSTIFRLYSLTKPIVSVSVFKLIEEGKLSLDNPLSKFFQGLPKQWKKITIKNLLSHSSGLPDVHRITKELSNTNISDEDFIKLIYNDNMDFATGEDWRYNQTNFLLLKLIIEKLTNTTFEDYILNNQFPNTTPKNVLFSSDPFDDTKNRTEYYDFDKKTNTFKMKPEFPGKRSHPLNGINITLDEYINWNIRLDNNELIKESTKSKMWTLFDFKNSNREFLYGWDVYNVNNFKSYGFSGGSVSGFRKFVGKDLSIIVLMNGYKYYSLQDIMIDYIAGQLDSSLIDNEFLITEDLFAEHFLNKEQLNLDYIYEFAKSKYPSINLEKIFKTIGYRLFFDFKNKEAAIKLFKLNVKEYPESYDTYGSLGYLYFLTKQYEIARENYVKAQELNPQNSYSERTIKQIDKIMLKEDN